MGKAPPEARKKEANIHPQDALSYTIHLSYYIKELLINYIKSTTSKESI